MNIPLYITLFRMLCVPGLVILLLSSFKGHESWALSLFIVAALSDIADGVLARKIKGTSTAGALLDPIADKLLISSAFICLVELGAVAAWIVVIIIGREIAMTGFRALASSRGHHIASSPYGRLKMWVESITIGFMILGPDILGDAYIVARIGIWVVLAVVIFSAVEYFIRYGIMVLSETPFSGKDI